MDQYDGSLLDTSPPPSTAVDLNSSMEESPAKRVKYAQELTNLCDTTTQSRTVTLLLKNNEEICVERNVLSFYSTYFRTLFSSAFRDANNTTHRIRLVSTSDLRILFSIPRAFEKGLRPDIGLQRAVELLEPAAYLGVDIALDHLSDVICSNLDHENIIKIFRIALLYHTELAFRIWRAIIRKFQTLFVTNAYLKLREHELISLLTDKHLNIRSEDEKTVVANWMKHNTDSQDVLEFSRRNFARKPQPDSGGGGGKYEVIRNRQPINALVSFGGWASRDVSRKVEVYNTRCERWQVCSFNYNVPTIRRAYNGIELVDDQLVVFGGFNGHTQFQTTVLFDLKTKKWRTGMNMHDKRCYLTSTSVRDSHGKDMLYACGGMNGISRLRTAEVYDLAEDRWTEIADMKYARSDGATITLNNRVVAVGGFDGRHVHSHGEIYDPHVDKWTSLGSPMRTRRTGCTAVSLMDNVCLVIGGFNGQRRLDTSEMYDVREGIWHPLSLMHTGRSNFGACHMDSYSVYVAGGFDGQATTRDNERLDLRNRRWQALPDLNEAKSALRLVKLSDHPFLDELFDIPDDPDIVTTW